MPQNTKLNFFAAVLGLAALGTSTPAQAAVTATFKEVGPNIEVTWSGSFDTSGYGFGILSFVGIGAKPGELFSNTTGGGIQLISFTAVPSTPRSIRGSGTGTQTAPVPGFTPFGHTLGGSIVVPSATSPGDDVDVSGTFVLDNISFDVLDPTGQIEYTPQVFFTTKFSSISYVRSPLPDTGAIPEPSRALLSLAALGAVTLGRRRR